jgi:hypothetical protein
VVGDSSLSIIGTIFIFRAYFFVCFNEGIIKADRLRLYLYENSPCQPL